MTRVNLPIRAVGDLEGLGEVGEALKAWKADLVADLGGPEVISTQQATLVDLAVRTRLILDSVDAWLLEHESLVNAERRAVLPVVKERQQLVDSLARLLGLLGLERRARKPVDLATYLSSLAQSAGTPENGAPPRGDQGAEAQPTAAAPEEREP